MRFSELFEADAPLKVVATKRFIKNAQSYIRSYSGVLTNLREFLNFKVYEPRKPFNGKDALFVGQTMGGLGIWHCHLMHGKVILVYKPIGAYLELIDMVEHAEYDSKKGQNALVTFIQSLGSNDFQPYAPPKSKIEVPGEEWDLEAHLVLPEAEMNELNGLLWEMAAHDRDILDSALQGNVSDLMEFMTLAVPRSADEIVEAYGGKNKLLDHIRTIIRQMQGR